MHRIDIRILDARLKDSPPHYATPGSAGLDLRACIEAPIKIHPGETTLIPPESPSICLTPDSLR